MALLYQIDSCFLLVPSISMTSDMTVFDLFNKAMPKISLWLRSEAIGKVFADVFKRPFNVLNTELKKQLRGVVAYLTRVNTAYRVTHLYANGIHARDEFHAMNLVSWIETFIFIRGVII